MIAKQSSEFKVIFLTLKTGGEESGPSCTDTIELQSNSSALLSYRKTTQNTAIICCGVGHITVLIHLS